MDKTVKKRKLSIQGKSIKITLPKKFVLEHNLKKGQSLTMICNGLLIVFPNEEAYQKYNEQINKTTVKMASKELEEGKENET